MNHTALIQALEVISTLPKNKPLTIFFAREPLFQLAQKITFRQPVKTFLCPDLGLSVAGFNLKKIIQDRIKYHLVYQEYFNNITKQDIYFFNHVYWDFGLKIIQDLAKKNKVYFYNHFPLQEEEPGQIAPQLLLKYLFGLKHTRIIKSQGNYCSLITNEFIAKNRIRLFTPKINPKLVQEMVANLLPPQTTPKVLVLAGGDLSQPGIDKKNYRKNFAHLIKILLKFYKKKDILVKMHPRFDENIKALKPFINAQTQSLPAELLITPQTELLIALRSTTFSFDRPYLRKLKRIALLNIFYTDSPQRDIFLKMQKGFHLKTFYPGNFDQLVTVLKRNGIHS